LLEAIPVDPNTTTGRTLQEMLEFGIKLVDLNISRELIKACICDHQPFNGIWYFSKS
jgi:hypothetical protein